MVCYNYNGALMTKNDKVDKTKASFGFQWNYFDNQDIMYFKEQFMHRTGLTEADIKNKVVLDVGCGMGRYSLVMVKMGAKKVVGIDYSDATNKAKELVKTNKISNIEIYNRNIFNLHFNNKFDFIFSDGVLHHTGDTEKAFNSIVKYLKQNGYLYIMIYEKQNILKEFLNKCIRSITTRLPKESILIFSNILTFFEKVPIINKIGHFFFYFGDNFCDNFDWYAPPIQDHHSEEEVVSWFKNAGFKQIKILSHPNIKSKIIKKIAIAIHGKNGGIIRILAKK